MQVRQAILLMKYSALVILYSRYSVIEYTVTYRASRYGCVSISIKAYTEEKRPAKNRLIPQKRSVFVRVIAMKSSEKNSEVLLPDSNVGRSPTTWKLGPRTARPRRRCHNLRIVLSKVQTGKSKHPDNGFGTTEQPSQQLQACHSNARYKRRQTGDQ